MKKVENEQKLWFLTSETLKSYWNFQFWGLFPKIGPLKICVLCNSAEFSIFSFVLLYFFLVLEFGIAHSPSRDVSYFVVGSKCGVGWSDGLGKISSSVQLRGDNQFVPWRLLGYRFLPPIKGLVIPWLERNGLIAPEKNEREKRWGQKKENQGKNK